MLWTTVLCLATAVSLASSEATRWPPHEQPQQRRLHHISFMIRVNTTKFLYVDNKMCIYICFGNFHFHTYLGWKNFEIDIHNLLNNVQILSTYVVFEQLKMSVVEREHTIHHLIYLFSILPRQTWSHMKTLPLVIDVQSNDSIIKFSYFSQHTRQFLGANEKL